MTVAKSRRRLASSTRGTVAAANRPQAACLSIPVYLPLKAKAIFTLQTNNRKDELAESESD